MLQQVKTSAPSRDQHRDHQLWDHINIVAKMDMSEKQTSMLNQSRLIDMIAAPAVASQTSHILLDQAEEVMKRHDFWKANAVDWQRQP